MLQAAVYDGRHYSALATCGRGMLWPLNPPVKSLFLPVKFQITISLQLTRSILHGYFNPLVFWNQWEYLLTSKEFNFLQGI